MLLHSFRSLLVGSALLALAGTSVVSAGAADTVQEIAPFHVALANRSSQTVDIAMVGDSLTASYGMKDISATLSVRLAEELRERFPTAGVPGGNGFIGVGAGSALVTNKGGLLGWDLGYGPAHSLWGANSADRYLRTTVSGSAADIVYYRHPSNGSLYWSIDGGPRTVIPTTGTAAEGATLRITFPRGTHTLEVGWASGGYVWVEGVTDFDGDQAAGIRTHNLGWMGATTEAWKTGAADRWTVAQQRALTPELAIIQLGGNDFLQGRTSAAFRADLTSLIASIRAQYAQPLPVVVLMSYEIGNLTRKAIEPWANFVAAARAVAEADIAAVLVNLGDVMPPAWNLKSGYYQRDRAHATAAGLAFIADHLAGVLGIP